MNLIYCRKEPEHAQWNIKATHTWELILNWQDWADTILLENETVAALVENLVELFETLYTWSFVSVADAVRLETLRVEAPIFIKQWKQFISNNKERNYYHWLAYEAYNQIKLSGSVWKYSSDITESFVHVLKTCFLRFTNRGGGFAGSSSWTEQALFRVCVQTFMKSLDAKEWSSLLSAYEKRKIIEYVVQQMREFEESVDSLDVGNLDDVQLPQ